MKKAFKSLERKYYSIQVVVFECIVIVIDFKK